MRKRIMSALVALAFTILPGSAYAAIFEQGVVGVVPEIDILETSDSAAAEFDDNSLKVDNGVTYPTPPGSRLGNGGGGATSFGGGDLTICPDIFSRDCEN